MTRTTTCPSAVESTEAERVGAVLTTIRESTGLSVEDAAERAGTSATYWRRVEAESVRPTPGWASLVSAALAPLVGRAPAPE